MTDTVDRLRAYAMGEPRSGIGRKRRDLFLEAAAEIAELRGMLIETVPDPEYRKMQDIEIERLRKAWDASIDERRELQDEIRALKGKA